MAHHHDHGGEVDFRKNWDTFVKEDTRDTQIRSVALGVAQGAMNAQMTGEDIVDILCCALGMHIANLHPNTSMIPNPEESPYIEKVNKAMFHVLHSRVEGPRK